MTKKIDTTEMTATEPKFSYTTAPGSLRKFLGLVPNKPKPSKFNADLYKSWGLKDTNANTITRVLRSLDLVSSSNEATPNYEAFMHKATGPAVLGARIRALYSPLFVASHSPHKESDDDLRNLFNIHSGGGEQALRLQINTFKTLCDFASFDGVAGGGATTTGIQTAANLMNAPQQTLPVNNGIAAIHIDLHIHLPENRTTREYEAIIQDIATYIYKHEVTPNGR
jgi:hypothetical protein